METKKIKRFENAGASVAAVISQAERVNLSRFAGHIVKGCALVIFAALVICASIAVRMIHGTARAILWTAHTFSSPARFYRQELRTLAALAALLDRYPRTTRAALIGCYCFMVYYVFMYYPL